MADTDTTNPTQPWKDSTPAERQAVTQEDINAPLKPVDNTIPIRQTYAYWKDIIDELDAHDGIVGRSQQFIISLKERQPAVLSIPQIKWLNDLQERFLA